MDLQNEQYAERLRYWPLNTVKFTDRILDLDEQTDEEIDNEETTLP